MRSPDIIGIVEIEKLSVLQALANKVNADAGTPGEYVAYLEEGNDPGAIDVGFLVKSSRVNVTSVTQYGKTDTYINPNNGLPALLNDRPPLVLRGFFSKPGCTPNPITVIVNHLRSLNDIDDPVDGNRVRHKRRAQAEYLAGLIQGFQLANPADHIISVGDYNAFQFNDGYVDMIGTIKGTPTPPANVVLSSPDVVIPDLINLVDTHTPAERYSYSFDGSAQVLDHILVNNNAYSRISRFAIARVDADFPEIWRSDPNRPERISDHDAPVAYILFPGPPTPTITPGGPTTFCAGGSVTLTSSSATDNQWYLDGNPIGGATNQNYVATAQGTYTVIVTISGCPSAPSVGITVTVTPAPATPTITPGGPTTFCAFAGNSVTLTSSSATGNQWFLGGNPIGGATNQTYVAIAAGDYTVIVTLLGCSSAPSAPTTVTVNPIPPTPTITPGGPTTFCAGGSVTLTSSLASGNQWFLNGNPIGGASNQTYVATAPGDYSADVTSLGCTSPRSSAITVTVNPAPPTPTITPGGPTSFCAGGSVTLTSSSATGNQWYLDGNPIGGATNQSYVATAAGNYTVVVTSGGCPSAPSAATTVTVTPAPPTPTITPGGPTTLCAGGSVTLSSSSATGNQWYINDVVIVGATDQTYNATTSGLYTVVVTSNGCPSALSIPSVVSVKPLFSAAIGTGGPTTFCAGGSVTLDAFPDLPPYYLHIVSPVDMLFRFGIADFGLPITTTPVSGSFIYISPFDGCTPYAPGSLAGKIAIIDRGGCDFSDKVKRAQDAGAIGAIIVNNAPFPPIVNMTGPDLTITIPSIFISQADGAIIKNLLLTQPVNGQTEAFPPTYLWSTGATTQTISATTSGTYTVTVTIAGCSVTSTGIVVTVNPAPVMTTAATQTICSGSSTNINLTASTDPGTVFTWTLGTITGGITGATACAGPGCPASIAQVLTNPGPTPGTVEYIVTPVSAAGCPGSPFTITVTVNPLPVATATPSSQTVCSGSPITTMVLGSTTPGTIFTWTRDMTVEATGIAGNGTGDIAGTLTNTTNAPVTVTFTITPSFTNAGLTCTGTPITATVEVNPIPTVVATPPTQTICSGSAITPIVLTSNVAGAVFNWTRDNTTNVTGIATPGVGDISGSLTNTTNIPQTVTFTITPSFTRAAVTCPVLL